MLMSLLATPVLTYFFRLVVVLVCMVAPSAGDPYRHLSDKAALLGAGKGQASSSTPCWAHTIINGAWLILHRWHLLGAAGNRGRHGCRLAIGGPFFRA
jgi:hypothetical protein